MHAKLITEENERKEYYFILYKIINANHISHRNENINNKKKANFRF